MAELSSPLARLATFRAELYAGCTRLADALLELADALLFAQAIPSVARCTLNRRVPHRREWQVVAGASREEIVSGLVRIGEKEMTGEDEAEVDAYFAPDFRFHGPDGGEWDYQGLKGYFAALRAAFDNLTITRGIVIVEGNYVACQTSIIGTFVREFTHTPVGPLPRPGTRSCSS